MGSCQLPFKMVATKMVILATLLVCSCLAPTQAATIAELEAQIAALQAQLAQAQTQMASVQGNLRTTIATASGDAVSVVDAYLSSGTKCGPQTITSSWSENVDKYYAHDSAALTSSAAFTSGRFTAPVTGWYKICAFFRFRNTGNSNDVTLRLNGNVVAAFGHAIQNDWRSTGTCTIQKMTASTSYVELKHESGSSSDCIEETGWFYGRFNAHLVACSDKDCA